MVYPLTSKKNRKFEHQSLEILPGFFKSLPGFPKNLPRFPKSLFIFPKSLTGFPKSLPSFPNVYPVFRNVYLVSQKAYPIFRQANESPPGLSKSLSGFPNSTFFNIFALERARLQILKIRYVFEYAQE